jgi:hypothetical protein
VNAEFRETYLNLRERRERGERVTAGSRKLHIEEFHNS